MESYWIKVDPKSNENILIRNRKGHTDTQGKSHVKAEAGIGVILPQAEKLPGAGGG